MDLGGFLAHEFALISLLPTRHFQKTTISGGAGFCSSTVSLKVSRELSKTIQNNNIKKQTIPKQSKNYKFPFGSVDEQNPAPPLVLVFWKYLVDNKGIYANPHARSPPKSIGNLQTSIVKHPPPLPTCPPTPQCGSR